jgi:hypothetical protein
MNQRSESHKKSTQNQGKGPAREGALVHEENRRPKLSEVAEKFRHKK